MVQSDILDVLAADIGNGTHRRKRGRDRPFLACVCSCLFFFFFPERIPAPAMLGFGGTSEEGACMAVIA
jgi:hypothetical protein